MCKHENGGRRITQQFACVLFDPTTTITQLTDYLWNVLANPNTDRVPEQVQIISMRCGVDRTTLSISSLIYALSPLQLNKVKESLNVHSGLQLACQSLPVIYVIYDNEDKEYQRKISFTPIM